MKMKAARSLFIPPLFASVNSLLMPRRHNDASSHKSPAFENHGVTTSRREALGQIVAAVSGGTAAAWISTAGGLSPLVANAAGDIPDRLDEEEYLRRGFAQNPMGVSGQAGKSRPETGVVLLDGSEVSRNAKTGDVSAEILLQTGGSSDSLMPVLTSYSSPWPLATGTVFDVECRDPKTGDGAFLAVTSTIKDKTLTQLPDSFFTSNLFSPTGRFSFYGQPTDVKVIKSSASSDGNYKTIDVSFATLSQSTQTEIPRKARIVATVPPGASQAVLLVTSASALRWNKLQSEIASTASSFRAIPAPKSSLKVRPSQRTNKNAA